MKNRTPKSNRLFTSIRCAVTAISIMLGLHCAVYAEVNPEDFEAGTFTDSTGYTLVYRLFVPRDYDPDTSYPIVTFLHGRGSRGSDNRKQVNSSGAKVWAEPKNQAKHPCFVLAPQTPENGGWGSLWGTGPSRSLNAVREMLDTLEKEFNIDKTREYITGLSGGGRGTWTAITLWPDRFAAAVPVCGRNDPTQAAKIAHIPVWAFHGTLDDVVEVDASRAMIKALEKAGGSPKYTEYPDLKHNSWDRAYATPQLPEWLFKHRLSAAAEPGRDHREVVENALNERARSVHRDGNVVEQRCGAFQAGKSLSCLPTGDWKAHGLSADQRERIRQVFLSAIEKKVIPGGSLMLIDRGEVIFREAFGFADLDTKRPFSTEDLCHLASLTKPFTSTLVAILVDEGELAWDDPVDKYLPQFKGVAVVDRGPAQRCPTIRELLSHTAGFPARGPNKKFFYNVDPRGTLEEFVDVLAKTGLTREPGVHYAYNSADIMVAGRVAEVVTGRSFDVLMREKLLAPIGATEARFRPSRKTLARIPRQYAVAKEGFQPQDISLEILLAENTKLVRPGGGLFATLDDVGRFLLLHRNKGMANGKQIVSAKTLEDLYVPQPHTPGQGYGLCFAVNKQGAAGRKGPGLRVQHSGSSGTLGVVDFEKDLVIVLLTQTQLRYTGKFRGRLLGTIYDVLSE